MREYNPWEASERNALGVANGEFRRVEALPSTDGPPLALGCPDEERAQFVSAPDLAEAVEKSAHQRRYERQESEVPKATARKFSTRRRSGTIPTSTLAFHA